MLLPPQRHPEPAEPHRQRPDGRVRGSLHRWIFLYHTRMSVIVDIRLARLICRTGGNGLEWRRTAAPQPRQRAIAVRSAERREGKERVRTWRSGWSTETHKKKHEQLNTSIIENNKT